MEHSGGPAWALALEHSGLGQLLREAVWIYPAINVTHVLAVALLLGSIAVFDLRVLGFGEGIPAERLARLALPVAIGGLAGAAPTGFLLFITEATAYVRNPVFLTKLALIVAALVNVVLVHRGAFRSIKEWGFDPPPAARRAAALSLALWLAIAACGRLIAYF
jgi:hypothetical protein